MGFKDSFKKMMFIDEEEEFTEEEIKQEEQKQKEQKQKEKREKKVNRETQHVEESRSYMKKSERPAPIERRISVTNPNSFKLVLIEPQNFEECKKLVDSLKARRPIIINLEKIETETAKKIFDFLSGATYALNGSIQRVSNNIFIFAPENVGICDENKTQNDKPFEFSTEGNIWEK